MKIITILSAAAAILASGVCVSAATAAPAPNQVRVGVADLDLSTPAGRASFDHRISDAAHLACGGDVRPLGLAASVNTGRCVRRTIARANADAARLTTSAIAMR
jgi:UrcA family protein